MEAVRGWVWIFSGIAQLGMIKFGHQTHLNSHKKLLLIEPNQNLIEFH